MRYTNPRLYLLHFTLRYGLTSAPVSSSCVLRGSWWTLVSYDHRLQFTACVSAVGELIDSYSVSCHQFADETQLLVSVDSTNATPPIDRLAHVLRHNSPLVPAERPAARR